MTLKTGLIVTGDSEAAKKALYDLDVELRKTAGQSEKVAEAFARVAEAERDAAAAGAELNEAQVKSAAAGKANTDELAAQAKGAGSLSGEMGQLARQVISGNASLEGLVEQGSDVVIELANMSGGAGAVAGLFGGLWVVALQAGAAAAVPLIVSLFETSKALQDVRDDAHEAKDALLGLVEADTFTRIAKAQGELSRLTDEQLGLQTKLKELGVTFGKAGAVVPKNDLFGLGGGGDLLRQWREKGMEVAEYTSAISVGNRELAELAAKEAELAAKQDDSTKATTRSAGALRDKRTALTDQQKALLDAQRGMASYTQGLADQVTKLGMTEEQVRAMERARQLEAAAALDQTEATKTYTGEIHHYADALKALFAIEDKKFAGISAGEVADENRKFQIGTIANLQRELALVGQVGAAREEMAAAIDYEAEAKAISAELAKAEAEGNAALVDQLNEKLRLLALEYGLKLDLIDANEGLDREAQALGLYNDRLRDTVDLLQNIHGMGPLGDLLGFVSGDYGGIGGNLGALLNLGTGEMRLDERTGQLFAVKYGDEMREIFGLNGEFGATMQAALTQFGPVASLMAAGNSVGAAAADLLGVDYSKGAGSLFGIVGGFLGGAIAGKPKGSVSIGGTGSNLDIFDGLGKNDAMLANANKAAGGIIDLLGSVADALGGTLNAGASSVSIGQRDGNWVVDPLGRGKTKGSGVVNFGGDYEAAVAAAIRDMLRDGVLAGVSQSDIDRLLAGDLEEQLGKLLDFRGVFEAIDEQASPFLTQMNAIADAFEEWTALAIEMGATGDQLTRLQAEQVRQVEQLIEQSGASYRSSFWSDEQKLAAARSQIAGVLGPMGHGGVDTTDEFTALVDATNPLTNPELYGALMGLVEAFGAIRDAAEEAADAGEIEAARQDALSTRRAQMEVERMQLQGDAIGALATVRALELAAIDPTLRALQQEIWQLRGIAEAKDRLMQAHARESQALERTGDTFARLGDSLRDFRAGLAIGDGSSGNLGAALADLRSTGQLAGVGDEAAMGRLPGAGRDYLSLLQDNASSELEYRAGVALVARYVDTAIGAADLAVSMADEQLAAMHEEVGQLVDLNANVLTVREAIEQLTALMGGTAPGPGGTGGGPNAVAGQSVQERETAAEGLRQEREDARTARIEEQLSEQSNQLGAIRDLLDMATEDGAIMIATRDGDTVATVAG